MRIYLLKNFRRFQRKEGLTDDALARAVQDAAQGLIDADLGGGLIKQRIARKGQGKSRGFRTVIAFRRGRRAVFLYGFAKSERGNIDDDELEALRTLGARMLDATADEIEAMIADDKLMEVHGEQGQEE